MGGTAWLLIFRHRHSFFELPRPDCSYEENLIYVEAFEADREYTEEEATYIQANHEAYLDLKTELEGKGAASYPSCQDVWKELQDRRKGRQYFRPHTGKGKGKNKKRAKAKARQRANGKDVANLGKA